MSYKTEMRNDQPQILTRRQAAALLLAPILSSVPFLSATAGEGALKLTAGKQPPAVYSVEDPIWSVFAAC